MVPSLGRAVRLRQGLIWTRQVGDFDVGVGRRVRPVKHSIWGASACANPDLDSDVPFTDLPPTPHARHSQEPAVPVLFALLFFVLAATYLAA